MWASLQLRRRELVEDICEQLATMALRPQLMPAVAAEMQMRAQSSASTPSLRSREGTPVPMDKGGNVKVVVRVRGFLPRGKLQKTGKQAMADENRNRERC